MSTTALFTITRTWKQLKSPSTAKWIKMLYACMHAKPLQSCPTLCNSMDHSLPDSSVMGFSRKEYWSELPCPNPGDFPDPGIKPTSLMPPALQVDSLPLSYQGKPQDMVYVYVYVCLCVCLCVQ